MTATFRHTLLGVIALGAAFLHSCDKLDNPVIEVVQTIDTTDVEVPEFSPLTSAVPRVLVEDFTAHQCGNCPPAGLELVSLMDAHPDSIVPLAIHAGNLAVTNADFPIDWTCEEGDEFWGNVTLQLNPIGRVNRVNTAFGQEILPNFWADEVADQLTRTPNAGIQMVIDADENAGDLVVHAHVTWLADVAGQPKLSLLVAENHVVGPQLWYASANPPGPGLVEDYDHKHVLRGSVTGAYGLAIAENPVAGDTHQVGYTYTWNDAWDMGNSEIIAVLTDDIGTVIQTMALPILP